MTTTAPHVGPGPQQLEDPGPVRVVELGGRLVGEEDRRLGGQPTGDRDALLLAAGQLLDEVVAGLAEAELGEGGGGPGGRVGGRGPRGQQREGDVLVGGQDAGQAVALRDQGDPGADAAARSATRTSPDR